MQCKKQYIVGILIMLLIMSSCSDEFTGQRSSDVGLPINLSGKIMHENVTRANDYGFVNGDRMGVYIVDRVNGVSGTLGAEDNRAQNVLFTYDDESHKWSSPAAIYWRDQQTGIDIYGYYPGVNYIASPTNYSFEVQSDQSTEAANGDLGGYEQSDLLWGKTTSEFTTNQIVLQYDHILAGVRVILKKGEGITDTEWSKLQKIVLVENTVRKSIVNLSDGSVALDGDNASLIHMAPQSNDEYRAVVIPQTVASGKQLLSITIDGQTYSHKLTTNMNYQSGKLHNFTMTVDKNEDTGDYEIEVTDEGITPWTNDEGSHQFTAMMYVTVNCAEGGKLKESITAAGYDYKTVQNLKVTGELTTEDFELMKKEMPELKHLNLKDVNIVHAWTGHEFYDSNWHDYYADHTIPADAFYGNNTIRSLILPTSLKRIGGQAFREMRLMFSTLEVPEGVTYIGNDAFSFNEYNGVELILPNTLDSIDNEAFVDCGYKCELKLSDNIRYVGDAAFAANGGAWNGGQPNFYGVFHLPSKLKELKPGMFAGLGHTGNFTGTIELPQGITETPDHGYWGSVFPALSNRSELILPSSMRRVGDLSLGGNLTRLVLNEGLEEIGYGNFNGSCPFSLVLPSTLRTIGDDCFYGGYEGVLTIPEQCLSIGKGCFRENDFTKINLPSRLETISSGCYRDNRRLTEVTIPKYVDYIGEGAFNGCEALQTVICLAQTPPDLGGAIFQGVYFDKCILQVPEASIETYRHTDGWNQFKNITAYHELAFNVPEIICLDKGQTVEGVIRAEGAWEVSECPSWVTVSPSSGTASERKAEVRITVQPLGTATEGREGRIVFKLAGKNYTTYTTVKQRYMGDYNEDQKVVLQRASAGAPREIPIFIVGEGYDADDIVSGKYLEDMKKQMEYLFSCEPYKTYSKYFTVSTAIAVSPEHGINGRVRFQPENAWESKDEVVWKYAKAYGEGISDDREGQTTIIVLYNSNYLGDNHTSMSDNGRTISYMGQSTDTYPYEQREYVLREVGGIGFGHLGLENVNHFTFLKSCTCPNCSGLEKYRRGKSLGCFDNISISGKMSEVPWRHLIFDSRYATDVDVFEGGYNHARGVYRSENMSIMGDSFIPYFNAISRQSIVKRILEYSGEGYTFEKFVANDKREYPE